MEEVKRLKPGSYILRKGEPFRILKNEIVVTGTHSHTKNRLEIQGLFSKSRETITVPPHDRLETVGIQRKKAQVVSKSDHAIQIMDPVSYETIDADSEELLNRINIGDEVTYVSFNNRAVILEIRG